MSRIALGLAFVLSFAPLAGAQEKEGDPSQATYLGIFGQNLTSDSGDSGVVVREVVPNSPAANDGLKSGDVILSIDEKPLNGFGDLSRKVQSFKPGDEVTLKILRNGEEQSLKVELGGRPKATPERPNFPFDFGPDGLRFRGDGQEFNIQPGPGGAFQIPGVEETERPMVGIQMQVLDDSLRERLELGDRSGVVIADVMDGSPAEEAGLKSTDVILSVDEQPVESPEDLAKFIGEKKAGDNVRVEVFRDGKTKEFAVTLRSMKPQRRMIPGPGFNLPNQPRINPDAFRGYFAPAGEFEKMQKRIGELEEQVKKLQSELESLKKESN